MTELIEVEFIATAEGNWMPGLIMYKAGERMLLTVDTAYALIERGVAKYV